MTPPTTATITEYVETLRGIRSGVIDEGKRMNAVMHALVVTDRHAEAVQIGLTCGGLALAVHRLSELIAAIGEGQS